MLSNDTSVQQSITGFIGRNKLLIAGVGLLVTFWMLIYTFAMHQSSYSSKGVVIVRDSAITSRFVEPENYYAIQTTSSSSSNPVLNTMGILKSSEISDALWQYFQTRRPEQLKKNKIKTRQDWERFFQDGSSFIKAKNPAGTDLITLQFTWSDPIIAKEGLDVIIRSFQQASRELNLAEQKSKTRYLTKQAAEMQEELEEIRHRKSLYQSSRGTVSYKREGDDLSITRLELSNKLSQLEAQMRGKENLVRRYQAMLGMDPEEALHAAALGQNGSLAKLQDELYRLEQQFAQLNSSLTDSNPKVREVRAQIEQVRANIRTEKARTMGEGSDEDENAVADGTRGTMIASMMQAQGEINDLRAQTAVLRGRLNQVNGRIQGFPMLAEEMANIEQKEASLSTALDHLRQKVLESKLREQQTLSNVFIVDPPRFSEKPQAPTRTHLIVLSVVFGLGCGLAAALVKEQLTAKGHTEPDWLQPLREEHPSSAPYSMPPVRKTMPAAATGSPVVEEKVPAPITGSLFDDLVPVAGPMRHQQPETFRNDLVRPIVAGNGAGNGTGNGNGMRLSSQSATTSNGSGKAAQVLPLNPSNGPNGNAKISMTGSNGRQADGASNGNGYGKTAAVAVPAPGSNASNGKAVDGTVKQAKPRVALVKNSHGPSAQKPDASLQGVPVLHATPQPKPKAPEAGIESEPPIAPQPTIRKVRGVPSFLLEESAGPPKKQLLSGTDNLLDDVAPLDAPADPGILEARRPTPTQTTLREPLRVSSFWFNQRSGLDRHGQKTSSLPGSLERSMQQYSKTR